MIAALKMRQKNLFFRKSKERAFLLLFILSLHLFSFSASESSEPEEFFASGKISSIAEYTLSTSVRERLKEVLPSDVDPYVDPRCFTDIGASSLKDILPRDLLERMESMRTSCGPDVLIIHNFPIDERIPPTPIDGKRPPSLLYEPTNSLSKGFLSEASILCMGGFLGSVPVFDEDEKDGTCINQIIPIDDPIYKGQQSSFGSSVSFSPHTENVYQIPPLKFFSLTCLRGDPKVATRIIFVNHIMDFIKRKFPDRFEGLLSTMKKDIFVMRTGPSFEKTSLDAVLPIVQDLGGELVFRLNLNEGRTEGTTAEAVEAVEFLRSVILSGEFQSSEEIKKIYLKEGDYILFNNWRVMHARDSFEIDEERWRWLQRCYFQ